MTDNHNNTQKNKPDHKSPAHVKNDNTEVNDSTLSAHKAFRDASKANSTSESLTKKVDIVLAGVTYPIFCPVNEEPELRSAVYELNNFMLDLKKQAPNQSQENILVLCCLNLYEKVNAQKRLVADQLNENKQTEAMLSKIINDARSIL